MAKGDSAASHHYWRIQDNNVLSDIIDIQGPNVVIPNNSTITVTKQGDLPLSTQLSPAARSAMILPGLKSASLVSIGQLCDDDCDVLLNKKKLIAIKNKKIVLQGTRNYSDGLWDIPIYKKTIQAYNHPMPPTNAALYPIRKI